MSHPTPTTLPRVAVVMPALNEEASIGLVLDAIPRSLPGAKLAKVVVADNGSEDDTARVARERGALVVHEPRRGYGAACLRALQSCRTLDEGPPDIVCFLDADFSDYPEDMSRVLEPILRGEADLVIGSRMIEREARAALLPQARYGNRLAVTLIRLCWGARYTDLGPFRAVTWEALERVKMTDQDFGWTVELQVKAARLGLRHREVPVRYRKRIGVSKITGTVKGTVLAGTKILYSIARYGLPV